MEHKFNKNERIQKDTIIMHNYENQKLTSIDHFKFIFPFISHCIYFMFIG